jgi:hypothetical protein
MMSQFAVWYLEKSGELLNSIGAHTNEKIQKFIEETEGLEGFDISFIQVGYAFDPDPITPEDYVARGPYGNPGTYKTNMDESVQRGWLENVGDGEFKLSGMGRKVVQDFLVFGSELFSNIPGLSSEENTLLANLLGRIVVEARKRSDLANRPTLEIGRRLEPDPDAEPMLRIRRYLTDLAYYRDDVHIEAWKPYRVDGKVWESLTYLWREEANSAAELAEQVSQYRNYEEADYAAALDELAARGWAAGENGKFTITEDGKKVRKEAEDKTDHLYAVPFDALSGSDSKKLKKLLEQLADVIKLPDEEVTEEN